MTISSCSNDPSERHARCSAFVGASTSVSLRWPSIRGCPKSQHQLVHPDKSRVPWNPSSKSLRYSCVFHERTFPYSFPFFSILSAVFFDSCLLCWTFLIPTLATSLLVPGEVGSANPPTSSWDSKRGVLASPVKMFVYPFAASTWTYKTCRRSSWASSHDRVPVLRRGPLPLNLPLHVHSFLDGSQRARLQGSEMDPVHRLWINSHRWLWAGRRFRFRNNRDLGLYVYVEGLAEDGPPAAIYMPSMLREECIDRDPSPQLR